MARTPRMAQIEAMLAEDPDDAFLRYGLAMEHASAGDDATAVRCLRELIAVDPTYVPAYLQAGQMLLRLGRTDEARATFRDGMAMAQKQGDQHAFGEMEGMLDSLE